MNLQLLKLVIWPKSDKFAPRVVEFKPGKVNVITGSSRTGKSAIIPIIDYCLASSDCFIPIDTIRDYAAWYGIVVQTESEQILLSRMVPDGTQVSNDFYILRASVVSIPTKIVEPNEKTDGVKNILNAISSVPYFSLEGNIDKKSYQARLGFRDLMALVFQNQDIVANQNILFYKTHSHDHRERLRNWFPFILGAENIDILKARQRFQEVEQRLKLLKREFEKASAHSSSWLSNMVSHLKVAKEYGLLGGTSLESAKSEELLSIAKDLIANIPEHTKTNFGDVQNANKELSDLEIEEEHLSTQIGLSKKRLADLNRLKNSFVDYGNTVRKRIDRLHISKWLKDIAIDSQPCPACGSQDHPKSRLELFKISEAFEKYELESKRLEEVPTSFSREEERINSELESFLEIKKNLQKRYDLLLARDRKAQEAFQLNKNMYLFIGHLKASMETFESLGDGGEFQEEIDALEKEYKTLSTILDRTGVQRRIEVATTRISQGMFDHLKTLDVEAKYREIPPKFDVKDLNILVLSNDEHWHFLAEVGSASNWVSFHIALFCALQEYFIEQVTSCVPSFVIFDQPSQVYFPKVKKENQDVISDPHYENEDINAVKQIFKTISASIIDKKGAWQSIILDHADKDIYSEIDGVYEVEEWRNGKKLIPEEWYKK
jgi:hypothetical protein